MAIPALVEPLVGIAAEIAPDAALAALYQERLARFRSLYTALKPEFA